MASALTGTPLEWLALRASRSRCRRRHVSRRRRERATPRVYAVSHVERYLECPFKYFAAYVLRLPEERDEESGLTPQERGQFLHEVFEQFFAEWQASGRGSMTMENVGDAVAMFERVAEAHLSTLSESDRALERTYLLGSAAAPGLAERAFAFEIEQGGEVVERLLEHELEGQFVFTTADGPRNVRLRAKADRIDLLADGTLRLVDYKLGKAPKPARALQLPVYGVCAEQSLEGRHGRSWTLGRAGYVAFREKNAFVAPRDVDVARRGGRRRAGAAARGHRRRSSAESFRRGRTSRSCARGAATRRCAARITSAMSDTRPGGASTSQLSLFGPEAPRRFRRPAAGRRRSGSGRAGSWKRKLEAGSGQPEAGRRADRREPRSTPTRGARDFAIDPRNNVVLEASAGTGKTSVLVWRYVNLLKAGVEPGNILAITFTRKAAAEMRERIIRELKDAAARSEFDKARWTEVRDRLADISISTIDAFCLSLLREFPLEADLDPGFEMADETEVPRLVEASLDRSLRIFAGLAKHEPDIARRARAARDLAGPGKGWRRSSNAVSSPGTR